MITVYIASPYTKGDVAVNVKRQLDCFDELMDLGYAPFAPLYSHFQHMAHPRPYEDWIKVDLVWVEKCDCLLRLPGESSGADGEVKYAKERGIPVFYSVEEMDLHYRQNPSVEKKREVNRDSVMQSMQRHLENLGSSLETIEKVLDKALAGEALRGEPYPYPRVRTPHATMDLTEELGPKVLNGFNNGRDTTDGVGGGPELFDEQDVIGLGVHVRKALDEERHRNQVLEDLKKQPTFKMINGGREFILPDWYTPEQDTMLRTIDDRELALKWLLKKSIEHGTEGFGIVEVGQWIDSIRSAAWNVKREPLKQEDVDELLKDTDELIREIRGSQKPLQTLTVGLPGTPSRLGVPVQVFADGIEVRMDDNGILTVRRVEEVPEEPVIGVVGHFGQSGKEGKVEGCCGGTGSGCGCKSSSTTEEDESWLLGDGTKKGLNINEYILEQQLGFVDRSSANYVAWTRQVAIGSGFTVLVERSSAAKVGKYDVYLAPHTGVGGQEAWDPSVDMPWTVQRVTALRMEVDGREMLDLVATLTNSTRA